MENSKTFFMSLHTILAGCGCIFNSLLIYVIVFHSPIIIRTYAALILNFAVTDLLTCIVDFFVQLRLVPIGWSVVYIANGPCRFFGHSVCFMSHNFMLHLLTHGYYSLLLSFSYRYYILLRMAPRRRKVLIVLSILYLPSFIQLISTFSIESPPEEMLTLEYTTTAAMVVIPVLTPIASLYFVEPYRRKVRFMLRITSAFSQTHSLPVSTTFSTQQTF
ncbi:unnamed protein product [Caenorhabditis auriculariae]|uniref:G-protein coupled receptors family 1 profile domain-containing protein n=1 Tax=Caenorhabditis auriculariae TaxID=2777116 RepID=A0A8S1HPK6_9PELO|nr:unnamed protein product [Caenorhabditis auriculariae]